ncbi:MAG TPA: transporter [Vicinamibacterales bacterium]|nr:transporter [Vicinamibacterales bacterium]
MTIRRSLSPDTLLVCILALVLLPHPAAAQLNTQHVKGVFGLKAGSQPPPGGYVVAPLLYIYNTDTVRNRNGGKLPIDADITGALFGAGYTHVTTKKVLGGYYGFGLLLAGANNRIQGTEIESNPGAGITDSVLTPATVGWHFKRADAQVQYTIYVPTGRYTDGAANNTGLGMWGHEIVFGGTSYLTEDRKYHAATAVSFNFQSKKEDSETKVGNAMNIEGGVGGDFLKGGLTVGLSYYWSLKLTGDHIEGLPQLLQPGKNRTFGLGPEVTLALARKNTVYGFMTAKYFWETYARSGTQGGAFILTASFLIQPLKIQTP